MAFVNILTYVSLGRSLVSGYLTLLLRPRTKEDAPTRCLYGPTVLSPCPSGVSTKSTISNKLIRMNNNITYECVSVLRMNWQVSCACRLGRYE